MASRSPRLYLRRKKRLFTFREPHPKFATNRLSSHSRPIEPVIEIRTAEDPAERLATRPIEETPAYVDE